MFVTQCESAVSDILIIDDVSRPNQRPHVFCHEWLQMIEMCLCWHPHAHAVCYLQSYTPVSLEPSSMGDNKNYKHKNKKIKLRGDNKRKKKNQQVWVVSPDCSQHDAWAWYSQCTGLRLVEIQQRYWTTFCPHVCVELGGFYQVSSMITITVIDRFRHRSKSDRTVVPWSRILW